MSKELEALERIGKLEVSGLRVKPTKTFVNDYNDYHIIETALKEKEQYWHYIEGLLSGGFVMIPTKDEQKYYQQSKALEIIKEYFILTSEYGKTSFELKKNIPEDKYDLLKEVLV